MSKFRDYLIILMAVLFAISTSFAFISINKQSDLLSSYASFSLVSEIREDVLDNYNFRVDACTKGLTNACDEIPEWSKIAEYSGRIKKEMYIAITNKHESTDGVVALYNGISFWTFLTGIYIFVLVTVVSIIDGILNRHTEQ